MLRSQLNAKNNDIKLIESNMDQHIKSIQNQMLEIVEENQRLKNQLSKVKISIVQLDRIVTQALLGRDAPLNISSNAESISDLPDDSTFQISLDQLCNNITEFIGHHQRMKNNIGVFSSLTASKSQFNKIRSLSTNHSSLNHNKKMRFAFDKPTFKDKGNRQRLNTITS